MVRNSIMIPLVLLITGVFLWSYLGNNQMGADSDDSGRESFFATSVDCQPCRTTFTGYQSEVSRPGPDVAAGYPFGFISQLNDAKLETPYANIPNVWPKDRSCDIEWNRSQPANPCKRQDLPTYFGSGIPIKTDQVCTRESDGESMFYFKNFRSSPECCPGPYSTDGGCVCAFEKPVCHKWPQDLSKNPARITFH